MRDEPCRQTPFSPFSLPLLFFSFLRKGSLGLLLFLFPYEKLGHPGPGPCLFFSLPGCYRGSSTREWRYLTLPLPPLFSSFFPQARTGTWRGWAATARRWSLDWPPPHPPFFPLLPVVSFQGQRVITGTTFFFFSSAGARLRDRRLHTGVLSLPSLSFAGAGPPRQDHTMLRGRAGTTPFPLLSLLCPLFLPLSFQRSGRASLYFSPSFPSFFPPFPFFFDKAERDPARRGRRPGDRHGSMRSPRPPPLPPSFFPFLPGQWQNVWLIKSE